MSENRPTVAINVPDNLVKQAAKIIYDEILMHLQFQPQGEMDWQRAVEDTMLFNGVTVHEPHTTGSGTAYEALCNAKLPEEDKQENSRAVELLKRAPSDAIDECIYAFWQWYDEYRIGYNAESANIVRAWLEEVKQELGKT